MNCIDSTVINETGIPGIVLMENAAIRVVEEISGFLGSLGGKTIFVFAGKGNNGGDAFAVARLLLNRDAKVCVYCTASKKDITGDALINLSILEKIGIRVSELVDGTRLESVRRELLTADVIIDGIFGTGIRGQVEGLPAEVIGTINSSGKPVISIDIPSGINGETGKMLGCSIKAVKTVTFALPKIGLVVHPGCEYAGELVVADISIPKKVIDSMEIKTNLIDRELVSGIIPERRTDSNKGDYGKVLVVTGSLGMTGAGYLTAGSALRSGSGLVYLGVPSSLVSVYDSALRESVTIPLEDEGKGFISRKCIDKLVDLMRNKDVVAMGPGLSVNNDITEVVGTVIDKAGIPLVLDADALNAVSGDISMLRKLKVKTVVTPHPGEMARLTGRSIEDIQSGRMTAAQDFASEYGVITVLKGAKTIVALPDGHVYINPTGNPGMASGGAGDVLTGIIAGLIGQGVEPENAAIAGVYIHGLAGDRAAEKKGMHGIIAGDIVEELPYIIKELVKNSQLY